MCEACKKNYDAVPDAGKDDLESEARRCAHGFLGAVRDLGVDPITMAAAATIAARMIRIQMDEGTLAVVDAIAERGWKAIDAEYARRGVVLAPRPHRPMEFIEGPVAVREQLHANDRPARAAPSGLSRRVTRVRH